MYLKGLRAIGLATEFNPLDNRSGLNNSIILTTGPVSTMSRKRYLCYRVPKKQKAVIRELRHYFRKVPRADIPARIMAPTVGVAVPCSRVMG